MTGRPEALDQTIMLNDGRRLGFAEWGIRDGTPVFFFHGMPASRLNGHADLSVLEARRVRWIGIDRPGIGLSDFQTGRRLVDWPDDVVQLADALGFERFAVAGNSAGGPYAAACAYKIPDRLTHTGIVSGVAPFDRLGVDGQRRRGARNTRLGRATTAALVFARRTTRGARYEMTLHARPWGFRPEEIHCEVELWHGDQDTNVPLNEAELVAGAIPNSRLNVCAGVGHGVMDVRFEEIVIALTR